MSGARTPRPPHRERFISASELGEYAYCRRAWWLRAVRGAHSEQQGVRFEEGREAHARHAYGLLAARAFAIGAAALIAAAAILWMLHVR